jgi:hypothetical protein
MRKGTSDQGWAPDSSSKTEQVLRNPLMSVADKRALLASWASDVNAVPDAPALRRLADGTVLEIDDILIALRTLDDWHGDDDPPTPVAARKPPVWTFELMGEQRAA